MRLEKQYISQEYIARLNQSPFVILVDYRSMSVGHFNELRKRLAKAGAEIHVIKNSLFCLAGKETGLNDLGGSLVGQLAMVTGQRDVSATAKVLKTFQTEFDRPKVQFGYLDKQRLSSQELLTLADLPSLEVLRSQLLSLINMPATRLVQMIQAPARQLTRVIQARVEKEA